MDGGGGAECVAADEADTIVDVGIGRGEVEVGLLGLMEGGGEGGFVGDEGVFLGDEEAFGMLERSNPLDQLIF